MRIATLIFFVAACLAMAAPAAAASYQINLPTKIEDAGSPIHITLCLAGRNNDIGNGGYNVNFVNTAPKAATAIEFVFRMRDAFDKVLGYQPAMRQGTFAPNVQQGRRTLPKYCGRWRRVGCTPNRGRHRRSGLRGRSRPIRGRN